MNRPRFRPQQTSIDDQKLGALAQGHQGVSGLMELAAQAHHMLLAIRPMLPATLGAALRSGRWDGSTWMILAPHGAAAAKLQQLRPSIEAALNEKGWKVSRVQVRVQAEAASASPATRSPGIQE